MHDVHAHTNYSDGYFLSAMIDAAATAGLEGIGFADHCTVSEREGLRDARDQLGFNLDHTYERRRRGIELLREETDIAVYDAVEMDYDPCEEEEIAAFLEEATFDYTIGSVHFLEQENVQHPPHFTGRPEAELDAVVEDYFDTLVSMLESDLFDVAAHPDLVERTPPLRGRATDAQYRRVAKAFADSRTIPEINAGRALSSPGLVHPDSRFLEHILEYDVPVTVGTDSHRPAEIGDRATFLEEFLAEWDVEPVTPEEFTHE